MIESLSPLAQQGTNLAEPLRWVDWRGSGCVLVVEDDDFIRAVVSRTVVRFGFTAIEAGDGRQAVARFEADPGLYALVLLDFILPGIGGKDVLSRFRQLRPDIRVVVMSGIPRQEVLRQLADLGPAGFLPKPFTVESIARALRSAVEP